MFEWVVVDLGSHHRIRTGVDGRLNRVHLRPGLAPQIVVVRNHVDNGDWWCDIVAGLGSGDNEHVILTDGELRCTATQMTIKPTPDTVAACWNYTVLWELLVVRRWPLTGIRPVAQHLAGRALRARTLDTTIDWGTLDDDGYRVARDALAVLLDAGFLTAIDDAYRLTIPDDALQAIRATQDTAS